MQSLDLAGLRTLALGIESGPDQVSGRDLSE